MSTRARVTGALGLDPDHVSTLLETAGRAPSAHNTQPWRFGLSVDAIELHADLSRELPASDPDHTEMHLACGAVLFNLRMALGGAGIRPIVTVFPDPDRPQLVALLRHGGVAPSTPEVDRLLRAVPRRHTDRHPFTDIAVTPPERHNLCRAARDEVAWLHLVTQRSQRDEVADLARLAHRTQMSDPAYVAELAAWTGRSGTSDGVPVSAAGARPEAHDPWVLRDFSAGAAVTRVPGKDFEEDPLIAVLGSHLGGRTGEVHAGQALQRVLLTATSEGLSVSMLSQIVEVPATRERLRNLIGGTQPPQAVLRVGRGWPVVPTPRRKVEDLVLPTPTRDSR